MNIPILAYGNRVCKVSCPPDSKILKITRVVLLVVKVLTLSLGHKLQINTDYVEGYCVKFFKACQSAPLSSLLCCGECICTYVTECVLSFPSCYSVSHLAFGCGNDSGVVDRSVWPTQ